MNRVRIKVKQRIDRKRMEVTVKEEDRALLSTRNLTNNKLKTSYIEVFKVRKVTSITVELALSKTKTYLRFHASLIKKALLETTLIII